MRTLHGAFVGVAARGAGEVGLSGVAEGTVHRHTYSSIDIVVVDGVDEAWIEMKFARDADGYRSANDTPRRRNAPDASPNAWKAPA
jgi:hypothetical protein